MTAKSILAASGIYCIRNTETFQRYIGQSANIEKRFKQHRNSLSRGDHHCSFLQRSFTKYGQELFEYEILELANISMLTNREQHWMDYFKETGIYNTAPFAGGSCLGRKHSLKTKEKISASSMGHHVSLSARTKISAAHLGKKRGPRKVLASDETRLKMRLAKLGKPLSENHKAKLAKILLNVCNNTLGKRLSDGHIAKIILANTGKKRSLPSPLIGRVQTPESIAKRAASLTGKMASIETKQKLSIAQLSRDKSLNKAISVCMREKWKDPEYRERMLQIRKAARDAKYF